jgi:DNA polymerase-1
MSTSPTALLRGQAAVDAVRGLGTNQQLCTLVLDPQAGPDTPPRVLAWACRQQAVLIDVSGTPQLAELLAQADRLAAGDAKAAHRTLLGAQLPTPPRWACASLCEQLLDTAAAAPSPGTGRPRSAHLSEGLAAAAQRFDIALPDVGAGLNALGAHAVALGQLVRRQSRALIAAGMTAVSRLEAAAVAPIAEMEHRGMRLDVRLWRRCVSRDRTQYDQLGQWARDTLGQPNLNFDDDAQLLQALQAVGAAPLGMRREALRQLPEPWGPKLAALHQLRQRNAAYGLGFLAHVQADGRIHPTFVQLGARTGRMACHAPNLQGISKAGGRRGCFRAPPGRLLVVADYQACELRILAHLSGDAAFVAAFARGEDVHAQIAGQIFGFAGSQAARARQRQVAKVVSFGLIYGMGPAALGRTLLMPAHEAEALQRRYFAQFPQVAAYLQDTERMALARGSVHTPTGRCLMLPAAHGPSAAQTRSANRRLARNMPIQGTSADILKLALAQLRPLWPGGGHDGVVHCVHDAIVVECAAEAAQEVGVALAERMVAAAQPWVTRVPMAVDLHVGQSWDS